MKTFAFGILLSALVGVPAMAMPSHPVAPAAAVAQQNALVQDVRYRTLHCWYEYGRRHCEVVQVRPRVHHYWDYDREWDPVPVYRYHHHHHRPRYYYNY